MWNLMLRMLKWLMGIIVFGAVVGIFALFIAAMISNALAGDWRML